MRDGLPISETGQQRRKDMAGSRCATLPSRKGAVYHSHAGRRKTLDDIFGRSLAASALSPGVERALAASRAWTLWRSRPLADQALLTRFTHISLPVYQIGARFGYQRCLPLLLQAGIDRRF